MPNKDVLTQRIMAHGHKGQHECQVLFDSGASHSFVNRGVALEIGTLVPLPRPMNFTIANGSQLNITDCATISVDVGGARVTDVFMVFPDHGQDANMDDMIVGASTMRKYGLKLDFEHAAILSTLQTHNPAPVVRAQKQTEVRMNEILKRILARLGFETIPDALTDEDAMQMIIDRCNRGYKAVAVPAVLKSLGLSEAADESTAVSTVEALKQLVATKPGADASAFIAKLLPVLGLAMPADLTDEKAYELIVKAVKKPAPAVAVASAGVLKVLHLPDSSTEEEVIGAIIALENPGNVISVEQHHNLEEQHRTFRLESLIVSSMQQGKLTPAEKSWALDKVKEWDAMGIDGLTTLTKFLEKRPKLMPVGERLMPAPKEDAMSGEESDIARQLGVSAETMKKYA